MDTHVRVLIVEDYEPDALLLERELRQAGFELSYGRVDTPEAMREALEHEHWDLIIADYTMPHFSGPEALRVLLESGQDIPFILVSGTVPEKDAIAMMKAGAQDFVSKQDRARLIPAVTRELREAEIRRQRRQAVEALRRSEENFRAIFDYTPAAVFAFDRNGIMLQANPACEELHGVTREQMVGRSMYETVTKSKDREEIEQRIALVFSGKSIENIEWQGVRKDGSTKWILTNVTPVFGPDGGVIMGLSLNIDITERKMSEKRVLELEQHKLEFYRRTIEAATGGKLLISDLADIEKHAGPALASWQIRAPEDLGPVRHQITDLAISAGMEESRVDKFILCIGEAITNAIKHASMGNVSLHRAGASLICVVGDNGRGIAALNLPEVALARGYSTAGTLGMGYKVMISFADRVYLATGPDGTTVAIEMALVPVKQSEFQFRDILLTT